MTSKAINVTVAACLVLAVVSGAATALFFRKLDADAAALEQKRWLTFQVNCDQRRGLAMRHGTSWLCIAPQSILDMGSP
jgi:hypothetical protein